MNKRTLIMILSCVGIAGCSGSNPKTGLENNTLRPCPDTPNCVSSQSTNAKHFIEPIRIDTTPAEAKRALLRALQDFKRATIVVNEDHYLRVEFVSRVFRFIDDVEFYFPETKGQEWVAQVRSASRTGYSDLGVNRKRIERIRRKLTTLNLSQ